MAFDSIVPATQVFAITPDNGQNLPQNARSLYIGVGGDLRFIAIDDTVDQTIPVADKQTLTIQVKKVFATGTTATGIKGLR